VVIELKEMYSLDIEVPLSEYYPDIINNFELDVRLIIGINKEEGGDIFDIRVCTPLWLRERLQSEGGILEKGLLIVNEYSFEKIEEKINKYIQSISVKDWEEATKKLSKVFYWEFDDYYVLG